jgi:hypothetical protein
MDFHALFKLYATHYSKLKNNKRLKQYLIYTHELHQIKKTKLKLGAITFEIRPLTICGISLTYTFEMVFSRQLPTDSSKKRTENILNFFK